MATQNSRPINKNVPKISRDCLLSIFSLSLHTNTKSMNNLANKLSTIFLLAPLAAAAVCGAESQPRHTPHVSHGVCRDSIILSDPAVLADARTATYYMTGTGGLLWKSKDLSKWDGPYEVAEPDTTSWMGSNPQIWAAELHEHDGKYYYFATFTNNKTIIEENRNGKVPRRASHILMADSPDGPYRPVSDADYLPADRPTLDGTFWNENGKNYMVFCGEWLHNDIGTMEAIQLAPDLSKPIGSPDTLFHASDSPWSREIIDGKETTNRVTDGPWLFRTGTGRLGMIWTSWIHKDYTMGVAYSESGNIKGPWIQENEPITPPNYGHGMIFRDLEGRYILSAHSHSVVNGRYIRRPTFWRIDISGNRLRIIDKLD